MFRRHCLCFYSVLLVLGFLISIGYASVETFPVRPPRARVSPSIDSVMVPKTVPRSPFSGSIGMRPPVVTYVPVAPRVVFSGLHLDDIVCRAISSMVDANVSDNGCTKRVSNAKQTVTFQVTNSQGDNKACEFELFGRSADLALGEPRWVERHRFFVQIAFDGKETVSLLVSDFEPMLRTTPELFPVRDLLFEYIARSNDAAVHIFQEKVKQQILQTIRIKLMDGGS